MKKSIMLLGLVLVLLVGLLFLGRLINNKMDGYVASKSPVKETSVTITRPTTPSTTQNNQTTPFNPIEIVDPSNPTNPSEEEDPTGPSDPTDPSTPSDPTTPSTTPTTPSVTAPTTPTTVPTTTPTTETTKPKGQQAPAVCFYDAQGNVLALTDFKDKPIVLCFWASWATGSEKTLALMQEYYAEYGEDIYFIAVNITDGNRETRELADAFLADKSYPFPVYYDLDGVCHAAFQVNTKPTTFFIMKGNFAYAYCKGLLTKYGLNTGIKYILPEGPSK